MNQILVTRGRTPAFLLGVMLFIISACGYRPAAEAALPLDTKPASPTASITPTDLPTSTSTVPPTATVAPSATQTATRAPTNTPVPTGTPISTETPIPTETLTPTVTPSPTVDFPNVTVKMQANCRYGPGTAYLYSHGLYEGDRGQVDGRNPSGSWLWIKPENLNRHCWVSASVVEIEGDIRTAPAVNPPLPQTTFAGPPDEVHAERNGDQVRVSWSEVVLSDDKRRGYLLEATVCQNGNLVWMAVHTWDTFYEFTDQQNCDSGSRVLLYTAEKHGYSESKPVPWP